jgi:arylsulfatase A-like enzyme
MVASGLNVLFITLDQWRGDSLGCVGHPVVRTPNLDRLAAQGVCFTKHFAQAAPCGPSRASLYTGQYLHNHRVALNGTPLDARFTNIALEARGAGYDPVLFGYTDQTVDPRTVVADDPRLFTYEGVLPGFRAVVDFPEHLKPWAAWLAARGHTIPANPRDLYLPADPDAPAFTSPTVYGADETEAAFLVESITDWIDANDTEPWFIHAAFIRPHPPFIAPEPYNTMYDPAIVPMPPRGVTREVEAAQHALLGAAVNIPDACAPPDDDDLRRFRATYYGMQSEVDAQLGRLFDWLQAHDAWDNTLIVLTSDHGEMLGDHYFIEKFGYFDGSYHIPLIIRDPRESADGTRGAMVDDFTENIDLMPTMLDAIGAPIPRQCEGRALTPYLAGRIPDRPREAVHWEWEFRDPKGQLIESVYGAASDQCNLAVYRDEKFKYVHFPAFAPVLFDLVNDPDELVNVAADPAYLPVVAEYAQKMLSWRLATSDRTLTGYFVDSDGLVLSEDLPA